MFPKFDPEPPSELPDPGPPPQPPSQTLEQVETALRTIEQERRKLHELVLKKLQYVLSIEGVDRTAALLGVNADTLHSWRNREHVPRDLRDVDVLLSWATLAQTPFERGLSCLYRECAVELDERRRQDILKAITLNVALALAQFGFAYEFKVRPQNRASLTITGPNLPRCKVVFYLYTASPPYAWLYLPTGGHKFEPEAAGVRSLVPVLKKLQAQEIKRHEYNRSIAAVDEKIDAA